jgi:hypothetical protein
VDVVGFALATGFLVAVYTVFGVIGRLLDIVSAGVRATVAPTMLSGFRAWAEPADDVADRSDDAAAGPGGPGMDDADTRSADERRLDPGLVISVTPLARGGRHRFAPA